MIYLLDDIGSVVVFALTLSISIVIVVVYFVIKLFKSKKYKLLSALLIGVALFFLLTWLIIKGISLN